MSKNAQATINMALLEQTVVLMVELAALAVLMAELAVLAALKIFFLASLAVAVHKTQVLHVKEMISNTA